MKTIEEVRKLFSTFDYSRVDYWMSIHSSHKQESSEDNFDTGRALEEIIQWSSNCLLSRDPGKNGYDNIGIDDTTYECKKVKLNKVKDPKRGFYKFTIKNSHPNSEKSASVFLADYYILGDYDQRKILVLPKNRIDVVRSANTKHPDSKSDYSGNFLPMKGDVVWQGDPNYHTPDSWIMGKGKVRDHAYHHGLKSVEELLVNGTY